MSSSIPDKLQEINDSLRRAGGHYEGYSCKTIWDDYNVQRALPSSSISMGTRNITDTRLWAKDGRLLFTVRSNNWNERFGKVTADDVIVNSAVEEAKEEKEGALQSCTLKTILENPSDYASYAGLRDPSLDLYDERLDREIFIRFQATFFPLKHEEEDDPRGSIEFVPEAYNHNTYHSDSNPRNLILLCTTQGLAIQENEGTGSKKLFHHSSLPDGRVGLHCLEAEVLISHKDGGSQEETRQERGDTTPEGGKPIASVAGVRGIATRSNVLMTIQIPLLKRKEEVMAAEPDTLIQSIPNKEKTKDEIATGGSLQQTLQDLFWLALLPFVALFLFVVDSFVTPKNPSSSSLTAAQQEKQPTPTTTAKQRNSIKTLEKRATHIEAKRDYMLADAKAKMTKGDRKGALFAMKRKKMYDHELDKIADTKMRLEAQVKGTSTMTKIRNEVGFEMVEESLNEIKEVKMAPQINNALTQPEDPLLVDDDANLSDLERLETVDLGAEIYSGNAIKNWEEVGYDLEAQEVPPTNGSLDDWLLVPTPHFPTQRRFCSSHDSGVSKGCLVDVQENGHLVSVTNPRRHPQETIIATVVICYVCSGGIPTNKDVKAAVDDMEEMSFCREISLSGQ